MNTALANAAMTNRALLNKALMNKALTNKVLNAAVLLVVFSLSVFTQAAADHHNTEHQLKAAFLYKFAAYVEWPTSAFAQSDTPLTIGVIGADKVAAQLMKLNSGIQINNRSVRIKLLNVEDNLSDLHVLFIGHHTEDHLSSLLHQVRDKPVLTVTESRGALTAGSIINFVLVDNYVRFEISVTSAELSQLKISARLLDVAQHIEKRSSQ